MNKINTTVLILLILQLVFFIGCKENLKVYNIKKNESIDSVADSILFLSVKCLTADNENLYFTDTYSDRIICLNNGNFSLNYIIGNRGMGPKELLGINQFAIADSLITVLNGGNNRINIFKKDGSLYHEYSLANLDIYFDTGYRFYFERNKISGYSSLGASPLTTYAMDNQAQTFWGTKFEFASESQTAVRNGRHLGFFKGRYLSVSDNLPIIEIYDAHSHVLLDKYDYSQIPTVAKSLKQIAKKNTVASNSYFVICEDLYITNGHLYILIADYKDGYSVNEIIEFELEPIVKPKSILKLSGKVYSTFCINKGELYGYNSLDNAIEKFSLP